ncbi:c2h2 finger domain containing protein [Grosmannia clavigera kw1407]|uniref:C2h2 finger domain containing protein n=1 Tax=Grosmannia clavigera (strain kw1407 / UAMH 11150) TaxID=655863 RepID=F0XDU9_GROCL|nr:c2h2 finger domain containing protein [Grosmannia clavigera kw1407]EFX03478.1 c2h2 finger domain containing protein [Grosmannia clavigera kw1407]
MINSMGTTNWTGYDLEAYSQFGDTSSFMTPSLSSGSSGSSGSISRSIMDGDENMTPGNFGYGETGVSFDTNCFNEITGQMDLYQPDWEWEPQDDAYLSQFFSDNAESKLELPNNDDIPLAISSNQSSQPSMKVHRGKSVKNRQPPNGAPKRRHKCLGCDKKFSRTADLQRHEKHVHLDERSKLNIVCDYTECPRNKQPFSRKDHYREHLRDSHGEDMTKRGGNVHQSAGPPKNMASSAGSGKGSKVGDNGKGKAVKMELPESLNYSNYEQDDDTFEREHGDNAVSNADALGFDFNANGESSTFNALADKEEKSGSEEERLRNCRVDLSWWRCSRCLLRVPLIRDDYKLDWTCGNPTCRVDIEPIRKTIREEMAAAAAAASARQCPSGDGVKLWGTELNHHGYR